MKPTKIISTTMINKPDKTGRLLQLHTDAGTLTVDQLAKHLGMSRDALRGRADRHGWLSPRLFNPLNRNCVHDARGNAEWHALSGRKREYNLERITQPGIYDHIYHSGGCDNVLGA